mgnify:CR=1 FL=1
MTIESIEQALGRCHQKSCKVLKELVNFGLVEQKKQGLGKPALITLNYPSNAKLIQPKKGSSILSG